MQTGDATALEPTPVDPGADADRLLRAQLSAIFAAYPSSFLASMIASVAFTGGFYWLQRDPLLFGWLLLRLGSLVIYRQLVRYDQAPHAGAHNRLWLRRFLWAYAYHGLVWGLVPWLFMPEHDLELAMLVTVVMMGMITGGMPGVAHLWSAVLVFVLPLSISLFLALLWHAQGDTWYILLANAALLHLGVTLRSARMHHRLLTDSLRMRFANQDLADRLQRQVEATERASADKTRFFAAASHDLRQPLHAIALFGAVLDKSLETHPAHVHAQRLMGAVHVLGSSLDTMLDVSRLDAGVVQPEHQAVPLNAVFQRLQALFAPRAEERQLQLRLRATPLWVRTDAQLLERLLSNLIENAIKYTPRGGVLVVARHRGERVWIDVVDTGIGIAPEHAGRVFDEFYQVSNPGRDRSMGLGIGLSIVRRLSGLLGHPVQLDSRPGRGSRFRVTVPTAPAGTLPPAPQGQGTPSAQRLPRRVLFMDDETDITDAATAFLGAWGVGLHAVRDEAGAAQALDKAALQGKPFDALVCDYRLAEGANGLDAALRLRERFDPSLPLLLITGETAPERLQRVRESGVPVLFKPVPPALLLQALSDITRP